MSQEVHILPSQDADTHSVVVGEHTIDYLNRLSIPEESKSTVCKEASDILSHCIPSRQNGCVTNLAVGYVQSGKTMSFTTLTALAADNGYKLIIYLTGTKNNLQGQTSSRLQDDLGVSDLSSTSYRILNDMSDTRSFRMSFKYNGVVVLVPILKHYKHINDLANLLKDPLIKSSLGTQGVLIIDDEADQASLNTYAHKNSKHEDWESDELSKTYKSILCLKRVLDNHSYIQYTATPQSLLLIDTDDILSPRSFTVLTPGQGYTGGKYFFKENNRAHIRIIPDDEVESKKNTLLDCPATLIMALRQFVLSVAFKVLMKQDEKFLSMMVHIDGLQDTNIKYKKWIDEELDAWFDLAQDSMNKDLLKEEFRCAYNDFSSTIENCPALEEIFPNLIHAIYHIQTHLVHSGAEDSIDWKSGKGHILVGANMLNRGFTIEKLSMTFMPRTTATTATADTIEQRCRFFGYKSNYIDVCRIYISDKARKEFTDYVDHEEILRDAMNSCPNHTLAEYKKRAEQLVISQQLKPTRTNVLSKDYTRYQMRGWKQYQTVDYLSENLIIYNTFVNKFEGAFVNCKDFQKDARNHRYVDLNIDEAIYWLSHFQFLDSELRDRKSATIQYLRYVQKSTPEYLVRFYQMAFTTVRNRKVEQIGDTIRPINLLMGHSLDGGAEYPGDGEFKADNTLSVQFHHIKLKDSQIRLEYDGQETCNLAIHYPDGLSFSYLEF